VPEVIDMVVAPRHGVKVIEEAARLGVKNIWLQPGLITKKLWSLLKARVECSSGVRACGVEIETCSFATAGLLVRKAHKKCKLALDEKRGILRCH